MTTSGIGSKGIYVSDSGSNVAAASVAVTTKSGFDSSTGSAANGVFASNSASATLSGGAINTIGNGAYGVGANNGAIVKLTGTTNATAGSVVNLNAAASTLTGASKRAGRQPPMSTS